MLTTISLASLCLTATWVDAVQVVPPPTAPLNIIGPNAPRDVALMPRRTKEVLSIAGPVRLRLQFFGLIKRVGRRVQGPGQVTVSVDDGPLQLVELIPTVQTRWSAAKHPRWQVTEMREMEVALAAGPHVITLAPSNAVVLGYGLHVGIETVGEPPAAQLPPPDVVAGESEQAPVTAPVAAIAVVEPSSAPPEVVAPMAPGFVLTDQAPPTVRVTGAQGTVDFLHVTIDSGLHLRVVGPGLVVLEVHANRSNNHPETQQPIVVGILLDDVLVQTVALDQPLTDRARVENAPFELARRVTVRLPIKAGGHDLSLSLSDNATDGITLRPTFEPLSAVEPTLQTPESAREGDLVASDLNTAGTIGIGLLAGGFVPWDIGSAGVGASLEGRMRLPALGDHALLTISAGAAAATNERDVADVRAPQGRMRLSTTLLQAPLTIDLRWQAAVTRSVALEAGGGIGLLVSRVTTSALGAESSTGVQAGVVGELVLGMSMASGPGRLLARAALLAGNALDTATVRHMSTGGVMLLVGYTLGG